MPRPQVMPALAHVARGVLFHLHRQAVEQQLARGAAAIERLREVAAVGAERRRRAGRSCRQPRRHALARTSRPGRRRPGSTISGSLSKAMRASAGLSSGPSGTPSGASASPVRSRRRRTRSQRSASPSRERANGTRSSPPARVRRQPRASASWCFVGRPGDDEKRGRPVLDKRSPPREAGSRHLREPLVPLGDVLFHGIVVRAVVDQVPSLLRDRPSPSPAWPACRARRRA